MAAKSYSSFSASAWQWKHSVFLNFNGGDVRDNFISFLYEALSKISSDVYIDYRLEPAEEIAPALMKAIESSRIAVIIFSRSYASSTWCLDELEKIMDWNKSHGQMVIPVFYNVDSSHVHDPMAGVYARAFTEHEAEEKLEQVQRWKDAMVKAANSKGWDSKVIRPDTALVDAIVKDVLTKLIQISPGNSEGLVGMDLRIDRIIKLLSFNPRDVCLLGIWGMGGIGKTTTARAVFNQILFQFDAFCFLENIREESKKAGGLIRLRDELLSKILGKKNMTSKIEHSSHLQDMLSLRKVLIVLDDLTDLRQLKTLLRDICWFGPGSRIIITCRDRDMAGKKGILGDRVRVIDPYEVKELNYGDSFELFCQNAFEQKLPTEGFWNLSESFVKYAGGAPLALEVLGRHLLGRDKEGWETSLRNLERGLQQGIQSVLKLSYDDLSEDGKNMFLDIAFFLNGENIETVNEIFEICECSVDISYLIDKCLITTSHSLNNLHIEVRMHHLLQEMGKEIERQKSRDPTKRARLSSPKDIIKVFNSKKECESIEGMSLDISKLTKPLQLDSSVFSRTPNLKFLKFYVSLEKNHIAEKDCKIHISEGLESLSDQLLYLYWYGYPLKFLPTSFEPTNLVVLKLPRSNLQSVFEVDEELENLIEIDLRESFSLAKIPCKAPNLRNVALQSCINFNDEILSSITKFRRLTHLDLSFCFITKIPSIVHLQLLECLELSYCSTLVEFPEVPRNIKRLTLLETAIKEVPSSIGSLDRLEYLSLSFCEDLTIVPSCIFKCKSLNDINLAYSKNISNFSSSEATESLLDSLSDLAPLQYLDLSRTNFETIPEFFRQFSSLTTLCLSNCASLQSLPDLPPNLEVLYAQACVALKTISSLQHHFVEVHDDFPSFQLFNFTECLKLSEDTWNNMITYIILRIQRLGMQEKYYKSPDSYFHIIFAGTRIPENCQVSFVNPNSGTHMLRTDVFGSSFLGFVFCAIIGPGDYPGGRHIHCKFCLERDGKKFEYDSPCLFTGSLSSEHVVVWYDYMLYAELDKRRDCFSGGSYKISFELFLKTINDKEERSISSFGIFPLESM